MAEELVDISITGTYEVTETSGKKYRVETGIRDTWAFEARKKSRPGKETVFSDIGWLVWHAARQAGHTQEGSADAWMAQVQNLQEVVTDDEGGDEGDDEGDDLGAFGPVLGADPTQQELSTGQSLS